MKNITKALLLSACVLLLVTASVLGTLAYLTDRDAVVNTFTVGQVDIMLDEAKVNPDGKIIDNDLDGLADERTNEGNAYHLLPGSTYVKDPTVAVKAGSADAYVRVLVTINELADLDAIFASEGADLVSIFNGYDAATWIYAGETKENDTITYEFRYFETVSASDATEDVVLDALFDSFTLPGEINGEELATIRDLKITVVAHAIQAAGFADADAAWAAFLEQTGE